MPNMVERILDEAANHEGRYLLPRRFDKRPVGTVQNPDKNEQEWEAARSLVENGEARWIDSNHYLWPGIELKQR